MRRIIGGPDCPIMAQVLFIVVVGLLRWAYGSDTTNSRCGVPLTVPDTNRRSEFKRANITDAVQLGAVCNDRSQGIYYIRNSTDTKKWIIYLEGSVGCGNVDDCNKRYVERPELMMSHQYPASIEGRDIFDPDPTVNPDYWDYNMVLIPYCTSDLWVGNSTWDPARGKETFRFNSSATYNQFVFRGLTVFRTVVGELLEEGMDSADDVSRFLKWGISWSIIKQSRPLSFLPGRTRSDVRFLGFRLCVVSLFTERPRVEKKSYHKY